MIGVCNAAYMILAVYSLTQPGVTFLSYLMLAPIFDMIFYALLSNMLLKHSFSMPHLLGGIFLLILYGFNMFCIPSLTNVFEWTISFPNGLDTNYMGPALAAGSRLFY